MSERRTERSKVRGEAGDPSFIYFFLSMPIRYAHGRKRRQFPDTCTAVAIHDER